MLNFFKPTKDKIKILLFFLIVYFVISFIFSYVVSLAIRGVGENIKYVSVVNFFSEALLLLIVSYLILVLLKKKVFVARYWIEFIEILVVIFLTEKFSSLILSAFSLKFFSESNFLNFVLVFGLVFKILLYYIMSCFISWVEERRALKKII